MGEEKMKQEGQINLGSVEKIALGQGQRFVIQGKDIAVFRTRDGKIFAIEDRCPHRQGPLSDGIVGGGQVICPLHGHKFDLETGKGSDGQECVEVFKAWEQEGKIILEYVLLNIDEVNQPRGEKNALTKSSTD